MKGITLLFTAAVAAFCISCSRPAATPEEQVASAANALMEAFRENDVAALYGALPKSYQDDISGVMKSFGEKMDADVWNGLRDLAMSAFSVLATKTEFVVSEDEQEKVSELRAMAEAALPVLESLSLDAFKKGDAKAIVGTPEFSAVFGYLLKMSGGAAFVSHLGNTRITKAEINEDGSANVHYVELGNEGHDVWVCVDGAWVASEIAEGWKANVADAMRITEAMSLDENKKAAILSSLPLMKLGVDQLKDANDRRQFQQKMQGLVIPFMMIASQL